MAPSKPRDEASEEQNPLYFVWFSAHRSILSSKRLNLGQDASRWPKMRPLEALLGLKTGAFRGQKMLWGGETSRHQGHFRTVFYRSKLASC